MEHKIKNFLLKGIFQNLYVFKSLQDTEKILISATLLISLLAVWPDFIQCVLPGRFVFPWSLVISTVVYKSFNSNSLKHFLVDVPWPTSPLCSTRAQATSETRLQHSCWPWANMQRKCIYVPEDLYINCRLNSEFLQDPSYCARSMCIQWA